MLKKLPSHGIVNLIVLPEKTVHDKHEIKEQ